MKSNRAIPIAFNMSLGLIPILLCMILTEFIQDEYALFICSIFGIAYSVGTYYFTRKKIFNLIAYIATAILIVFTVVLFFFPNLLTKNFLPFTLSTTLLVCTALVFYGQRVLRKMCSKIKDPVRCDLLIKSLDSSVVSARLIFIIGLLHFVIIFLTLIVAYPPSGGVSYFLFRFLPILLLLAVIGLNQLAIYFANSLTKDEIEIPIVNEQGDVVGRRFKMEAANYKNAYINPIVRIAYIHDGMLFLCERKPENIIDTNKADIPVETFLEFEETLQQGVSRILNQIYNGEEAGLQPRFSLKHHFKTEDTNRLIYLYIAYIEDEQLLRAPYFVNGKLWTFQQIEQNIGMNYFGREFEYEYEYLKETVKIWEEFK